MEYPLQELKFLHNQIEERAYIIEQNLEKLGKDKEYSLPDIGCGEGFLLQYFLRAHRGNLSYVGRYGIWT